MKLRSLPKLLLIFLLVFAFVFAFVFSERRKRGALSTFGLMASGVMGASVEQLIRNHGDERRETYTYGCTWTNGCLKQSCCPECKDGYTRHQRLSVSGFMHSSKAHYTFGTPCLAGTEKALCCHPNNDDTWGGSYESAEDQAKITCKYYKNDTHEIMAGHCGAIECRMEKWNPERRFEIDVHREVAQIRGPSCYEVFLFSALGKSSRGKIDWYVGNTSRQIDLWIKTASIPGSKTGKS